MAKCSSCGKWGLFLKLNSDGLCAECISKQPSAITLPELDPPIDTASAYRGYFNKERIDSNNRAIAAQMNRAAEYNQDYVIAWSPCCCADCAKYRDRVYSISGNDKRFPKMPQYVIKHSLHCGFSIYLFTPGINYIRSITYGMINDIDEVIEISNRPFTDDRKAEEIERYNKVVKREHDLHNEEIAKERDRVEYGVITEQLPDIAPKSFGAYRRMKKAHTDGYERLKIAAENAGISVTE